MMKLLKKTANLLGWTRDSYTIMGLLVLICGLVVYIWWPLAAEYLAQVDWHGQWWKQGDWLLVGIWLVMSLLLMARANIKADLPLIAIGMMGGLVIESWGTQTELWVYYTNERPPLWIIPAWPVAALTIDRLVRLIDHLLTDDLDRRWFVPVYWAGFAVFGALMVPFVWPTVDKSLTVMALVLCVLLIATPKDYRIATLTFLAGTGLGYFLELWGTTRLCWIYYTRQQPPAFAVVAHGMAAVAFWRVLLLAKVLFHRFRQRYGERLPRWVTTWGLQEGK
jgi:hypothetical protein